MKLFDDLVVLRIVLKSAPGVDCAGDAQPVELSHEVPARVDLVFRRQLWALRECGIQDVGVRPGDENAGRITSGIANDLPTRRIGRVLGIADLTERGAVQKRPVIEVKDEHRGIRSGPVQLVERRHPALGELKFGPSSHHSHPLARRRSLRLLAKHAQTVCQRRNAVPPKLQVVVEAAANQVKVGVIQPRNYGALVQVDQFRPLVTEAHDFQIASDCEELAVANRRRLYDGATIVLGCNFTVVENHVCCLLIHGMPPGTYLWATAALRDLVLRIDGRRGAVHHRVGVFHADAIRSEVSSSRRSITAS